MELRQAQRRQAKIKLAFQGPSGSGKTMSALLLASGMADWSKMTPRHNAFVQKILESPCHIISTIRTKTDYAMVEKNGRYAVEKLGMKGITRDGMDYEFTLVFDLDIKHLAKASKDRTGLFMDKPEEVIMPEHGNRILKWCNSGTSLSSVKKEISSARSIDELRKILRTYPEYKETIEPLAISRKEELSAKIINQTKISGNGISKG